MLKHHPDKKASSTAPTSTSAFLAGVNLNTNDDAFFKCISKAHEVLSNPEKRRQFDSVDPHFLDLEEDMPSAAETKVRPCLASNHSSTLTEDVSRGQHPTPQTLLSSADAQFQTPRRHAQMPPS